jgi:hypothetical protein
MYHVDVIFCYIYWPDLFTVVIYNVLSFFFQSHLMHTKDTLAKYKSCIKSRMRGRWTFYDYLLYISNIWCGPQRVGDTCTSFHTLVYVINKLVNICKTLMNINESHLTFSFIITVLVVKIIEFI